LWGRPFTLYTDHKPLTFIKTQADLPATIANWTETILSYDFKCVYRPGLLNIIPDALSRAFPSELWASPDPDPLVHRDKRRKAAVSTRSGFRAFSAPSSPELVVKAKDLANHMLDLPIDPKAPYIHQPQTPDKEMITPPESERQAILKDIHETAHLGANAMVNALHLRGITWPKLKDACLQFIRQCSSCQYFNIARRGYHPLKAVHANLPGEHLAMDLAQFPLSTRQNNYALLVVDVCTRFVFLRAIRSKEAGIIAAELFQLFADIGPPKIIQSDNGSEFSNALLKNVLSILQVEHRLTTPYHPRGNGVAERSVRSVKDLLPKVLDGKVLDWDLYLPKVQLQLNTRVAGLHSSAPYSLFYGRALSDFSSLQETKDIQSDLLSPQGLEDRLSYLTTIVFPAVSDKSSLTQKDMMDKFNRSHLITEFPSGSYVMARDMEATSSLDAPYDGPYQVVRRTSHGTYILRDAMSRVLARNYAPEQLKIAARPDLPQDASETSYEVERIISHRTAPGGKTLYLVKWKGYDDSQNSEILAEHFDSKNLMTRYHRSLKQIKPSSQKPPSKVSTRQSVSASK
jgi:transposase InsO family protein